MMGLIRYRVVTLTCHEPTQKFVHSLVGATDLEDLQFLEYLKYPDCCQARVSKQAYKGWFAYR